MVAGLSLVAGGGNRASFAQPSASPEGGHWRLPAPRHATLSELFPASAREAGATGFLVAQLPRGKPLLWVQERMAIIEGGRIYPPGLGVGELIHVSARDARTTLWAMEEGLRCSALGAVIGEVWGDPAALDFTATRRLAVAAERNGVAAFLIRPGGHANLSGARMRWRITSAPSLANSLDPKAPGAPAWEAELFRARGFAPGKWSIACDAQQQMRMVSHDRSAHRFDLVAAAVDRALVEDQRRAG